LPRILYVGRRASIGTRCNHSRRYVNNGVWNGFVVQSAIVTTHTGKPKIVMAFLVKTKKNAWDAWTQLYETKCTDSQG